MLQQSGRKFLILAVKNKRVKQVIEKAANGKILHTSRFAMYDDEFGSAAFNLLVVKRDNYSKDASWVDTEFPANEHL